MSKQKILEDNIYNYSKKIEREIQLIKENKDITEKNKQLNSKNA